MKRFFQTWAQSDGVTVMVAVSYVPEQSNPEAAKWFWSYHIRIENHTERALQLRSRAWRVTDEDGGVNYIEGEGVVGEQPVLLPGGSYDYVSGCRLRTGSGTMEGCFTLMHADGSTQEARIPHFALLSHCAETQ